MHLNRFSDKVQDFRQLLECSRNVVLTTHHNPDGDALGSLLGMYYILKELGVKSEVLVPNAFPDFLAWLPGADAIIVHSKQKELAESKLTDADLVVSLDYNGSRRLEAMALPFEKSKAKMVLVDHHPDPESPFDLEFSYTQVSSTAELVYELGTMLLGETKISYNAAVNIFVGIMTDTGSFSYAIPSPRTFEISGKLIGLGVNVEAVQGLVYNTFSEGRMRLLGFALSEKMRVFPQHRAAYISLSKEELKRFGFSIGDTEGLVNYPLSIKGIVFSALFTENTSFVKVSLRSRGEFAVNEFCAKHFNGGGHRNAAGGKSFVSLGETEGVFERLLEEYSNQLNQ